MQGVQNRLSCVFGHQHCADNRRLFHASDGCHRRSVLTAVGELIVFPTIAFGFRAVELGYDLKINHGNTTIEIDND